MKNREFGRLTGLLGALLAAIAPALWAQDDFSPGSTAKIALGEVENPVLVYVPADYDSARSWPAAFHYHGTNGQPNFRAPLAYTGGRGFVLVGMEFTVRGTPKATPDYFEAEAAVFRKVRELVAAKVRLDPERLFIGGFSKGGWIAGTLAEAYLPEVAGAYLLGAGKTPFAVKSPLPGRKRRSLYIGVGQLELNFPYGVRAIKYFTGLGFEVTFDGYPGLGHSIPMREGGNDIFQQRSPAFLQWWQVQQHRNAPAPLKQPVTAWFGANLALAENGGISPRERFLALHRARRVPFYRYLNAEQRKSLQQRINALAKHPDCEAEIAAQKRFFDVVNREAGGGDFARLHQLALDYHQVYHRHSSTYHGALAALASGRISRQLGDLGNWRFANAAQRQAVENIVAQNPIPKVASDELLNALRATEAAVRVEAGDR